MSSPEALRSSQNEKAPSLYPMSNVHVHDLASTTPLRGRKGRKPSSFDPGSSQHTGKSPEPDWTVSPSVGVPDILVHRLPSQDGILSRAIFFNGHRLGPERSRIHETSFAHLLLDFRFRRLRTRVEPCYVSDLFPASGERCLAHREVMERNVSGCFFFPWGYYIRSSLKAGYQRMSQ
jgi:hypothetical protein